MIREDIVGNVPLKVGVLAVGADIGPAFTTTIRRLKSLWGSGSELAVETMHVAADAAAFARVLRRWCDRDGLDLVCTVGRSCHRREDFVPDVTGRLLTRTLPGVEERMYLSSPKHPEDLLFRGRAGIRRRTLVVNLPARPARIRAILGFLALVLPHALEKIRGSDRECGQTDGSG